MNRSGLDDERAINSNLPEGGQDTDDPLRPEIEEGSATTPPIGNPQQDTEVVEGAEGLPEDDSDLSDIDEAEFDDFDPAAVAIEERPVAVDESNVALIGVHKRKRPETADSSNRKKKKEGRREKHRRTRKAPQEVDLDGDEDVATYQSRQSDARRETQRLRKDIPENDESLTPEERRKKALDKAMDEALKNPNRRRRKADGIDLETQNDDLIENMRRRMTEAAKADTDARQQGQPAMHKLRMLPEVVALLSRNTLKDQLVDPDTNLLEAVRFFLEPLNDGSLPAYNIQRELFSALSKLPINKEALIASGIGKVTLFYTKSQKPEANIKRQAERLLGEWTRPILKRSDDYRKREFTEASYDPRALPVRSSQSSSSAKATAAAVRERQLAPPTLQNRARVEGGLQSYNIVPKNNLSLQSQFARPMGASGESAFRRMKARQLGKVSSSSKN